MDWIDEKLDVIGKWIHNLSLRKALIYYIILCVASVIILYAITMQLCDKYENQIFAQYYDAHDSIDQDLVVYIRDYSKFSTKDEIVARSIDFIKTWSIFMYSIGGILGVSLLFYHKKLKEPLLILKNATNQVGKSKLDMEIYYNSKDEMGDLCHSFDLMRKQLITNNQKMWDVMEEQKRLNAAFAHDLRTPLTVLRGYTDFLNEYLPQGKISEEKLLATLSMMSRHIERLERYSNTMKEIHSFDEIPVHQTAITWVQLVDKIEELIKIMNGRNGIAVKFANEGEDASLPLLLDEAILMEVFENLISNAMRYANTEVRIMLMVSEEEHQLMLVIADDGKGFRSKDLAMATKPYYTDSQEDKSNHFGIGLYICKLLCEKHGGSIGLANSIQQGAIVTASFYINDLSKRSGTEEERLCI